MRPTAGVTRRYTAFHCIQSAPMHFAYRTGGLCLNPTDSQTLVTSGQPLLRVKGRLLGRLRRYGVDVVVIRVKLRVAGPFKNAVTAVLRRALSADSR